jgi:hypothetical protein
MRLWLSWCPAQNMNIVEYDYAGGVTEEEAWELATYLLELREQVCDRLNKYHFQLLNP